MIGKIDKEQIEKINQIQDPDQIKDTDLDEASGGLIYNSEWLHGPDHYVVYHDTTGEVLGRTNSLDEAKRIAHENGQSDKETHYYLDVMKIKDPDKYGRLF